MWGALGWCCPPSSSLPPFLSLKMCLSSCWPAKCEGLRTEWWRAAILPSRGHFWKMLLFLVIFSSSFSLALQMSVALLGPLEENVCASNLSTLLNLKKSIRKWNLPGHFSLSPEEECRALGSWHLIVAEPEAAQEPACGFCLWS